MSRSRRGRHEDECATETQAVPAVTRTPDQVSPLQRRVLDLQRYAGSAAVSRLLLGQDAVVARAARRGRGPGRPARPPGKGPHGRGYVDHDPWAPHPRSHLVSLFRLSASEGLSPSQGRARRSEEVAAKDVTLEVDAGSALEALRDTVLTGTRLPWASIAGARFTYLTQEVVVGSVEPSAGGRTRPRLSIDEVDVRY